MNRIATPKLLHYASMALPQLFTKTAEEWDVDLYNLYVIRDMAREILMLREAAVEAAKKLGEL